jgi:hypothetical protein
MMTPTSRTHLLVIFALSLTPSCSSPNPNLYTVAPTAGQVYQVSPSIVLLQSIALERYLERSQIVRSSENYRLTVSANDWWGEPLANMLSRVLVTNLSQRLPRSTVINESGAISAKGDATITLNIRRMDEDATGQLVLQAQAGVLLKGRTEPIIRNFQIAFTPSGPGTDAEVAAVSQALGQLSDGLAAMVAEGR